MAKNDEYMHRKCDIWQNSRFVDRECKIAELSTSAQCTQPRKESSMKATEYFKAVNDIADDVIRLAKLDVSKMNEQEKQIAAAFCFGVLNGYSLEHQISAVQIHGAVIAMLVQKLQYDPAVAAQLFDFLVRCTKRDYHPVMYVIIHRGIEGYYQLGDAEKLRQNISEIIAVVSKHSG